MSGVLDCCRICLPNSYSLGNRAQCQRVATDKGILTPFGAPAEISCTTAGFCVSSAESRKIGWRTCRPCEFSDMKRADCAGVCKECKDEKMDFADKTMQPPSVCQLCSSCQQLIMIPDEQVLHVIKTDAEWCASIILWEVSQEIKNVDLTYMIAKASATWEGREEGVKTPSLQEPGSGQIQCTSWRNFAPFTTSTITDIHASTD